MGIYFRDILLISISRGANNCGQHALEKNIYFIMRYSPHFQLFYFNDRLEFCEFFEWKIKRINNADLFSQTPFLTFIKGANISGGHCRCAIWSKLSFESHVSSICKTAFLHLKNISKLRPMLSMSNAETLIHLFMTSRLDYCNALLGGSSACLINKLQLVQNAAARVLTRTRKYDHISPVLSTLHWLPIKHCIDF